MVIMLWTKSFSGIFTFWLWLCLLQSQNVYSFVVPEDVYSLDNYLANTLPCLRLGTDSRLGFGYRLRDHGYFQVVLELGPQTRTRPLGRPENEDQSIEKRERICQDSTESQDNSKVKLRRQSVKKQNKMATTRPTAITVTHSPEGALKLYPNGLKMTPAALT